MTGVRAAALASVAFVFGAVPVFAQDLSSYRGYTLQSSVATVAKLTGARESNPRTMHLRPARIQELEWRAPYVLSGTEATDPVHDILFSFYDDQLYQVLVTYGRDRTVGLTTDDVIESVSATYGPPLPRPASGSVPDDRRLDATTVARWESAGSLLTLTRTVYPPQFQLVLVSKTLMGAAAAAIKEALRLDIQEAPQRALDQRKKEASDASVATEKARVLNKAAFRP